MQKYEIREENIKVFASNIFRIDISGFRIEISGYLESFLHFELQVVRIGKEGTEAVEVEFILTLFFSK